MSNAMKYENIKTDNLIPYANNAKIHHPEQVTKIASSIQEFGFIAPVIVDKNNGIIAGHGRVMAAKKLGLEEVPCLRVEHLTEAQKKAYILADNRLGEVDTEWDLDLVKLELANLQELEFDINLTGFDDLFEELDEQYAEDADGEITDPPADPVTKLGDIWVMGKHRLMCGDSASIDALETLCDGHLVDMWLTDPPYNVAYEGKTKDALTIQNDDMSNDDFRQFLRDCYTAADAVMKGGAVFYIWHADSEGYNFRGAAFDAGWQVRQCLIWNKNTFVMGRQDYHWKHEPCLYGWKEGAGHLWASDRKQSTVINFDKPMRNGEHPTMKPVELFEYCLLNNTKGQDVVLDSFGGSGTTLIAAEKNNRIARIMELDPKYCDVIIKRWQDMTGKEAVLESSGDKFNDMFINGRNGDFADA